MKLLKQLAAVGLGAFVALSLAACGRPLDDAVYTVSLDSASLSLLAGDASLGSAKLTAEVLRDGESSDMVATFTVSDPSIAEVDAEGNVTAKKYGKTTVTAACGEASATADIAVYETATAENVNSFSEEYINLFSRTYETDGAVHFDNPATGFEVSFTGESLTADVTVEGALPGTYENDVYVCIYVDGQTKSNRVRIGTDGTVTLAEGLGEGIHTVRVIKSSEVSCGAYVLHSLDAPQFLRAQEKSDLKIEFIGDSITAGYGDLAQGGDRTTENSDACSAYAYLTAQTLGADFSVVAYSGISVKAYMYETVNMVDMHTYYSLRNKTPYPYDADTDIVVLNLGTNDASYINDKDPSYGSQFRTDYGEFVAHLRDIYPKAHILCIYGMMGKNSTVNRGIKNAVEALGDEKIVYLDNYKKNDGGAKGHPAKFAHTQYAKQLSEYIQTLLAD